MANEVLQECPCMQSDIPGCHLQVAMWETAHSGGWGWTGPQATKGQHFWTLDNSMGGLRDTVYFGRCHLALILK